MMARDYKAVSVQGLGKLYKLGATISHDTLRDAISDMLARAIGRGEQAHKNAASRSAKKDFWALKDISFDVAPGEVVGIIGRNGAGKSTLLKLLSRITEPTEGEIRLRGRVASLLEVGTGFHPELTGKENVFLNGTILGMRRQEILSKYDEITEFAGVQEFMDTPVKRYSSGMRVRLAFAVAAHLEPEILIIDEVLAVGDVAFQEKCLGKMDDVATSGRTILFVSHNMAAVENLCKRGIVLHEGRTVFDGGTSEAIDHYLSLNREMSFGENSLESHPGRSGGMQPILKRVRVCENQSGGTTTDYIRVGDDLHVEIEYDCGDEKLDYAVLGIDNRRGDRILTVGTHQVPDCDIQLTGHGTIQCRVPEITLMPGEYSVTVGIGTMTPHKNLDAVVQAVNFRIEATNYFGNGAKLDRMQGIYSTKSSWNILDGETECESDRLTDESAVVR